VLAGKRNASNKGKTALGRTRRRWENYAKLELKKIGYEDTDWIKLAQERD
jgi:hypothetical protein